MPNNQRPDYVSPHQHSPNDIQGLAAALFPPTLVADGAAGATTSSMIFVLLPDMTETFTPPDWFPLWEAQVTFTGTFSSDTALDGVVIELQADAVAIDNTRRQAESLDPNSLFELVSSGVVDVVGGTAVTIRTVWGSTNLAAVATASGTQRKMEITLRPKGGIA